jgi:FMN phosphatase YigB (HAD superfamily)
MLPRGKFPAATLGLLLTLLSFAPAPPEPPPPPAPIPADQVATLAELLRARHRAAQKQFDETWVYYRQARTDAFPVYVWSHFLLQTQFDLSDKKPDQIAALEGHLERMKRLEELLKKVRRLGFGQAIEVGAVEYYRIEGEYWLAHARSQAQVTPR